LFFNVIQPFLTTLLICHDQTRRCRLCFGGQREDPARDW